MQLRASVRHGSRVVTISVVLAGLTFAAGPGAVAESRTAAAVAAPGRGDADGRLVYLLEYVGMDYGHAVQEGEVVDKAEYGEVLRLLKELARDYGARRDRSPAVASAIAAIEKDVVARAPAERVYAASRELLP